MRRSIRTRLALSFAAAVVCANLLFGLTASAMLWGEGALEHSGQRPLEDEESDEREHLLAVLMAMGFALPVTSAAAALFGRWLAGKALAPLREATVRATAARASDTLLELPLAGDGAEWDQLATTMNALLADARSSLERIRNFTADAAHELRTPLTSIMGEAEVTLRRERDKEGYERSLATIREQAERLGQLITSLLTLARADGNMLLPQKQPIDLNELVCRCVDRLRPEVKDAGAALSVGGYKGPLQVDGDAVLLSRVVDNLLQNALRHGGRRLEVEVGTEDPALARVTVMDDGRGVPSDFEGRLFERFARAESSRSGGGVGLGLAVAQSVATAHGGALSYSRAGGMTRFTLTLPRHNHDEGATG